MILATGDIHGDTEMLEAYCPIFLSVQHSQYTPKGANTGDGHKMGLWAGGVMEEPPFPTIMHPQGYNRMQAFFLYGNCNGDRFMNEDTWCQAKSLNVLKQPGNVDYAYSIFDSEWQAQMIAGMPYSGGLFNDNSYSVFGAPFTGETERTFIESGLTNGLVVKADTQDPYSSLNPRMSSGDIVGEPLKIHKLPPLSISWAYRAAGHWQRLSGIMRCAALGMIPIFTRRQNIFRKSRPVRFMADLSANTEMISEGRRPRNIVNGL